MSESASQPRLLSPAKAWTFRIVAIGLPVLAGSFLIVLLLIWQGRLGLDENGRIVFAAPPLYLEEPGHELTGHRYLYDETLGWRNIPNWRATTHGRLLTINDQGLRDRDYAYQKPEGVKRILVLGDSYAWGYGVSDEQIFTEVLEVNLAKKAHGVWEVINSGVSGWGTDQQYLYLQKEGLKYDPDIVVVAFFIGNDIDNNASLRQYGLNKPAFLDPQLTLGNVPVPRPRSAVNAHLQTRLDQLDPVELTVSILGGICDSCASRACKIVLMKFGIFLAPKLPYALELEARFLRAKEVADLPMIYFDLDGRFREQGIAAEPLLAGNDDGHWNAFGHRKTAELLEEFLSQQGLVP